MNWITRQIKKIIPRKKQSLDIEADAWIKCTKCLQMIYHEEFEQTQGVCKNCDEHLIVHPKIRFKNLFDSGIYEEIPYQSSLNDPHNFKYAGKTYKDEFLKAQKTQNMSDCWLIGQGKMENIHVCIISQNFKFLGGSIGASAAEGFIKACEYAVENNCPLICIISSGGARLFENQYALQSLPKMSVGISMLKDKRLPYTVVLAHPATGGTQASIGSLGTITLAEPGATIGFAGARVISQNSPEHEFPADFQKSESLLRLGQVDAIVHRHDLKAKISQILRLLLKRHAA